MQLYKQIRYKNYKRIEYNTIKVKDVLDYFESEEFKDWLDKNKDIPTKLNPGFDYGQAYNLFYKAAKAQNERGDEFESNIIFKNFKKLWGKQIKFIE